MLKTSLSFALQVTLCLFIALAFTHKASWADWKEERESLDKRVSMRGYTINYTLNGPHAFPIPENRNGTPLSLQARSMAETMKAQIILADRVFQNDLGLTAPMQMPLYANEGGKRIDVHIYDIGKGMGSTGDSLHMFDYRHFGREGPALTITIHNRWRPFNRTPEHEVFHAYQYAYTFFKNRWYLEGMARSMENLFRDGRWKSDPLPKSQEDLDKLLDKSYSAHTFWSRLALMCDPGCERGPRTMTTVGDGQQAVCGKTIVSETLKAFDKLDNAAADHHNIPANEWPEKKQRAPENNMYMLKGLHEVLNTSCTPAYSKQNLTLSDTDAAANLKELEDFSSVLAKRLEGFKP